MGMSARAWLNLGLMILLAGLALITWLKPGQPLPAKPQLTTLDPETITHISIQRAGQPAIELARRSDQWWLTAPLKAMANEVRVGELLNLAITTSDTHYKAAKLNLAKYGLAMPEVSVKLNDQTFAFGDINPFNYRRYVRVGDTVYLITDSLADLESVDTAAYVTPKLIPSGSDIRALILPGIKLERMEDGQWKSSPEKLPQAKIQALVNAWREAQAYDVAAYKKTKKRLPSQATVKLAGGQALRFKVTVRKRELIMARPNLGVEYHLPMSSANSMLKPGSLPSNIPSS